MRKRTYAWLSAAALADVAIFIARRARSIDLRGRVAGLRSGSRGLVLSMARQLLRWRDVVDLDRRNAPSSGRTELLLPRSAA